MMKKISCFDVAKYFLSLQDEEVGEFISSLKLQKLVYYAQGFHLAIYDKPLFPEEIEAWAHGPVIPKLYHNYKKYGSGGIPPEPFDIKQFSETQIELLNEIWLLMAQYSAWKLRNITHEEPPWKNTYPYTKVISHSSMKEYFKTQIVNDEN